MATGEEVTDMVKCPICLEQRSELRKLPKCEHSFCEDCLVKYVERMTSAVEVRDGIPCPVCRTPNPSPENKEIRAWSQTLSKTQNISVISDMVDKCDACKVFGINNKATHVCNNCFELLCVPCSVGRHSQASHRNHKIRELNVSGKDDLKIATLKNLSIIKEYSSCNIHSDMELKYLCKDDASLCCNTCLLTRHRHCQNVDELQGDTLGEKVKIEIEKLKDDIDKASAFARSIIDEKIKNMKENEPIPENIRKTIQELRIKIINKLDVLEESVVEQAKVIVKNEKLSGESDIDKLNEAIMSLKGCSSLTETATVYGMVNHNYVVLEKTRKRLLYYVDIILNLGYEIKTVSPVLQLESALQCFEKTEPNDIDDLADVVSKQLDVKIPLYQSRTLLRDYRITKTSANEIKDNYKGSNSPIYSHVIFIPNNRVILVDTRNNYCLLISETHDVVSSIQIDAHTACYMKDGTVGVSVPKQNEILFLSVANGLKLIRRMKTKKTPVAIQCLNNGDLAVAWEKPVAFGIISCDESTTETVYFSTDKQGRELKSFEYMAVDEDRKHVIQPCIVDKAVYCFDYDGNPKFTYTNLRLDPRGVALDRDGNIYVCLDSYCESSIHVISPCGRAIRIFKEGCPKYLLSIAFKTNGTQFAVTQKISYWTGDRVVNFFELQQP